VTYQFASYKKKGHLAYVTINRPEVMNAIHPPASQELAEIWDDFQADEDSWVAILTGAGGRAFSAGNDLKHTAAHPGEPRVTQSTKGGFGGITHRFDLSKPVIAAVNGYALGGGFEMALACDIIVAADHARFGLPEPTVGLMAGAGGAHRLPRQIPLKIAMGMLLTGRHITAQEAHQWGLVNEVVPLAELLPKAEHWAAEVLKCAPLSVRGTKQAAYEGLGYPLERAINGDYDWWRRAEASQDAIEGPRAFSEKRAPRWTGR
jgi:enoyl-CoA hydratase/carnithine racemase